MLSPEQDIALISFYLTSEMALCLQPSLKLYKVKLSRVRFGCAMSSMVSTLSEDSAQFPISGPDLSEYSPNLPRLLENSGK